ncbi:hypothetical protein ABBQ32_005469 [Trebouxia sp. C0010 RCD-2024]
MFFVLVLCWLTAGLRTSTVYAARNIRQGHDRTSFPGCTLLSDSEIATNPDYSTLYQNLQNTGWNASLSDLVAVVTLFAPTDQAFSRFKIAYNTTITQAITQPTTEAQSDESVIEIMTSYHTTPEALPETNDFHDDQVLPTFLQDKNLTVKVDNRQNPDKLSIVSYGSRAKIVTPPIYACNLVICGIDSVLIPEEALTFDEEYDYGELLDSSHDFYRSQWIGALEGHDDIPSWRGDAFTYEFGPARLNWGDISGGLMQGGEAGTVKITPTIAWTTSMLAWGMLSFGDGYNNSGTDLWAKGKETLRWNTDYLLKTIKDDPVSSAYSTKPEFYIVYQVGNQTQEETMWTRPEEETGTRPAYFTTTYEGTSDLAGQISAAFSATAMVFRESDPSYYDQLTKVSALLYDAGKRRRGVYTKGFQYPCVTNQAHAQAELPECVPGDELFQGAMLATYNSTSWADDLTWAAAWLNIATGNPAYLTDAYRWYNAHYASTESIGDKQYISDWNQVIYPATLLLANITDGNTFHYNIQQYLHNWLTASDDAIEYSRLGRAFNRNDPSLAQGMNTAFLALLYAQLIGGYKAPSEVSRYSTNSMANQYKFWAQSQARYVLGGVSRSFYVGFGSDAPIHIQDRASSCPKDAQVPCNVLNAFYTPTPNPNTPAGALVYGPGLKGDYFIDKRSGSNETWVSHVYNAALTGVLAGLSQMQNHSSL